MKIPLGKPVFDKEMQEAAVNALTNERFVLGESVLKFEEEFAKYCGVDYAVSTNSGTDALQLALMSVGIAMGQRVITSPASFIASSNAIIHANAEPAFSDIELKSYTLSPSLLKQAVTPKTRAIIPVHLYGYPADMDSINSTAEKHGLNVIEDACQAHGALYHGKRAGSLGNVGVFSFYPSKNMTVGGDGGMIVTNDEKIAAKAAKLRDCGRKSQYVHDIIGYTARLNSVNAAIGRVQLRHLDDWNHKRRQIAETYHKLLNDIEGLIRPASESTSISPVFHLYVIRTKHRDELKTWLESNGISCGIHYVLPIHLQPIYMDMFGFKKGLFPNAEELCETCLSIPIYPDLSSNEIEYISDRIHEFFKSNKN